MTRRRDHNSSTAGLSHEINQAWSFDASCRYFSLSFAHVLTVHGYEGSHLSWTPRIPVARLNSMHVPDGCVAIISNAFNFLLKVLCNFPSRYLFAIELEISFNLRYSIKPDLYSHFGKHYSKKQNPYVRWNSVWIGMLPFAMSFPRNSSCTHAPGPIRYM